MLIAYVIEVVYPFFRQEQSSSCTIWSEETFKNAFWLTDRVYWCTVGQSAEHKLTSKALTLPTAHSCTAGSA